MKTLTCRDAGFDCNAVIKGDTEDEIMANAGEHAMKEHDINQGDMTPELKEKIRKLIRNS
jgi:predicted small metal-binding protein